MALPCQEPVRYPSFKLIIVGDVETGKTTYLKRHLTGELKMKRDPNIGVEVRPLNFVTNHGHVMFYCWDAAGQEDELFNGPMNQFYECADCAIIMFDVTAPETYKNVSQWHRNICRLPKTIPIVLCGNKVDRTDRLVKVKNITFHRGKDLAYFEISAKSNYNFEKPFLYLAGQLLRDANIYLIKTPRVAPPEVEMKAQQEIEEELA